MHRRAVLHIAQTKWPKTWRPIGSGLPKPLHPLPIQQAHVAQWFHALSDLTRLAILEFLSQRDRAVTDLATILGVPLSSVSFHLKVLRESGLVRTYRDGRRRYYGVRGETLDLMAAFTRLLGPGQHKDCALTCCQ